VPGRRVESRRVDRIPVESRRIERIPVESPRILPERVPRALREPFVAFALALVPLLVLSEFAKFRLSAR